MKLYQHVHSDSSRRVRVFLAEKGIEVPSESVDIMQGESRMPAFRSKNPLGQVPVLEMDDGSYLAESIAICRYFDETYPQPPLFGVGARERAEVEMWSRRVELNVAQPVKRLFTLRYIPEGAVAPATLADITAMGLRDIAAGFSLLDEALARHTFLTGPTYTIADIMALCTYDLATYAMRLSMDPSLRSLARWHAVVSSRPSARA